MADQHFRNSSYREKIIEHRFIAEMLTYLWRSGIHDAEILKPEVDGGGYDLVFQIGGAIRHIQLKSVNAESSTKRWKCATKLQQYPSGCVVVIVSDPNTLDIGPFYWFGGTIGDPLPSLQDYLVAKHTKANKEGTKTERPDHRILPKGAFEKIEGFEELLGKLFDL